MSHFRINSSSVHATARIEMIRLGGCIDFVTADELDQTIAAAIQRNSVRIVVDLGDVEYISSRGWSVFLHYLRNLREQGGDLKLANMRPDVFEVYKVLEFTWFLEHHDRVEDAITAFSRQSSLTL